MKEKSTHFSVALYCLIGSIILGLVPYPSYSQLAPIGLTSSGFNIDVVAEGTGGNPQAVTTGTLDAGTNNIFYTKGFQGANGLFISGGGLPNNGTITNGSDTWQLQPFSANNCMYFAPQTVVSTRSLTLSTAAKFSQIALMAASGNGNCSVTIFLHFTDGTLPSYGVFTVSDWFGGTPYVVNGLGRITRTSTTLLTTASGLPNDPRLYQLSINLTSGDQLKTLDRIDVQDNNTGNSTSVGFFAMSATFAVLALDMAPLQGDYSVKTNSVDLQWDIFNNVSGNSFDVQRSANGAGFTSIGRLHPNVSDAEQTMTYSDQPDDNSPVWFYRVKESSSSGDINYTNIISVNTKPGTSVKAIQSGGQMHLWGDIPASAYSYALYDMGGHHLYGGMASSANGYTIPVSGLSPGIYILKLQNKGQTQSIKFFKQQE